MIPGGTSDGGGHGGLLVPNNTPQLTVPLPSRLDLESVFLSLKKSLGTKFTSENFILVPHMRKGYHNHPQFYTI